MLSSLFLVLRRGNVKELSLHILDIMQNSIRAQATCIKLGIKETPSVDQLMICIEDNGHGMSKTLQDKIINPFTTTRTLRKVGLGIPLLHQLCEECGGSLEVISEEEKGTSVTATMKYDHIDRLPIGDLPSTLYSLIMARPDIHYIYRHWYEEKYFEFDTQEIKETLEGVSINEPNILIWIKDYIACNIENLYS